MFNFLQVLILKLQRSKNTLNHLQIVHLCIATGVDIIVICVTIGLWTNWQQFCMCISVRPKPIIRLKFIEILKTAILILIFTTISNFPPILND